MLMRALFVFDKTEEEGRHNNHEMWCMMFYTKRKLIIEPGKANEEASPDTIVKWDKSTWKGCILISF